jgi:hypothetical protein
MSRKSVRPSSSIPRPDDLSNHLVHSSHPLRGDEVGTRVEDDNTDGDVVQPDGTNLKRYGVIVPCPKCGTVQYMVGPEGKPQRECWECGHVFTPEVRQIDKVEQVVAWLPAKYNWSGTIHELVEGLAEGEPLKLTIATVVPTPEPEPIEGLKRCPDGHVCMHEPSGSFACCNDPSDVDVKVVGSVRNSQSEEEGDLR